MADCRTTATLVVNQLRDSLRTLGVTVTATVPEGDACPVIKVRVNAEGGRLSIYFAETDSWRLNHVPGAGLLPRGERLVLLIQGMREAGVIGLEPLEQIAGEQDWTPAPDEPLRPPEGTAASREPVHVEDEEGKPMQRSPMPRRTAAARARDREQGLRKAPDIV